MKNKNEIRALEEKLLQPEFRRNREAVAELLADDFREFGSSGRIWTKQQILDHLESEAPFESEMRDFDATELTPEVILATYKVTVKDRTSLRSSIWIKRNGRWQILFHQGTVTRRWSGSNVTKAAIDEALRTLHRKKAAAPEPGDQLPKGYRRGSLRKRSAH